jgi:hypothetical protein
MTQLLGFPSPADVSAQTPVDRDRVIDVIRIVSLLGVVVGHTVMATSMIRDHVLIWDNLLKSSTVLQALTWVFQIMPLFFFAGAAACVLSWRPGASWGGWLMKRCTRLYRPVFYYLAFWAVVLVALRAVLPKHVFDPVAGVSIQLLWFLGAYVLVLAATPLLYQITSTGRLAAGVAGVYVGVALVDVIRLHTSTASAIGYLNMAAWAIPGMFGVAYRRNLLSPRAALRIGLAMLGLNVMLCWAGPYEVSLVGIGDQQLANMSPPSLLMAGHAIMMCAFAIWAAPAIARWAQRPLVWWVTVIGNTGAMTLYLWHIPALLGMHLMFDSFGWFRFTGQPHLFLLSIVQVIVMAGLVSALFATLRPLENSPLPGWDGATALTPGVRSVAVGVLLCVASAATLASVKWGLKDDGLYCVTVMLAGLLGGRILATKPVVTAG